MSAIPQGTKGVRHQGRSRRVKTMNIKMNFCTKARGSFPPWLCGEGLVSLQRIMANLVLAQASLSPALPVPALQEQGINPRVLTFLWWMLWYSSWPTGRLYLPWCELTSPIPALWYPGREEMPVLPGMGQEWLQPSVLCPKHSLTWVAVSWASFIT